MTTIMPWLFLAFVKHLRMCAISASFLNPIKGDSIYIHIKISQDEYECGCDGCRYNLNGRLLNKGDKSIAAL